MKKILFFVVLQSLFFPLVGSAVDLQSLIEAGLKSGKSTIKIPAGRYEVSPNNGVHLTLEGVRDVTIDATDVEMVCTETTLAVMIKNCVNLRIAGLTIDYDPLPFTQGRIVEISEDRNSHVIEIMDGYPSAKDAYVFKHAVYTPEGNLRFGDYYKFELEVLSPTRLRIFGLNPRVDGGEQIGDIVVVGTQHLKGPYRPHAVMVENSVGTVFAGMRIYSSPCFGFFELASSHSVYVDCVIDRREGRMRSLNADAFHSKHAMVGPKIVNCLAMWQGDDCVNICGDYYLVSSTKGRRLRLLAGKSIRLAPGDPVELVTPSGLRLPDAVVVSVKPRGEASAKEERFAQSLNINSRLKSSLRNTFIVELDREVEMPAGGVIASMKRKGNGFVVRNCTFGNIRSRGILIKASEGEVSNNYLVNTHMEAIKIAPEYHWLESGFSRNVIVKNNKILNPLRWAIRIAGIGKHAGHENLQIVDNVIQTKVLPAIQVHSVRKGKVSNNEVFAMDNEPVLDFTDVRYSEALEH